MERTRPTQGLPKYSPRAAQGELMADRWPTRTVSDVETASSLPGGTHDLREACPWPAQFLPMAYSWPAVPWRAHGLPMAYLVEYLEHITVSPNDYPKPIHGQSANCQWPA
eukprot:8090101-Pyramimonas_sp.AAC.1